MGWGYGLVDNGHELGECARDTAGLGGFQCRESND